MTPWQFSIFFEERGKAEANRLKDIITGAWLTAAWTKSRQMPDLHDALAMVGPPKPREPIAVADLMAKAKNVLDFATSRGDLSNG